MADFKTAIHALSRGDLDFDVVSVTLNKMLVVQPELAVPIMAQLREAYTEDLIDATTYALLKKVVYHHGGISDDSHDATDYVARRSPTRADGNDSNESIHASGGDSAAVEASEEFDLAAGYRGTLDFDLTDESLTATKLEPRTGDPVSDATIGLKSVLKDRFILDEVLGVGGMGTVYRGRDLIKVEARDRNPYVALKILNEDFKQHPDSFIALQREASRQQKLAHPNIATVYDFDRTRGGTVFLTMEMLEGEPLNKVIRHDVRPNKGLSFGEAYPMIEGLGNALVYAHAHGIVHSDFKPGNCFKTTDGVMKVLDFGIARAVKNPGQSDGERTLFDPADLGALTPAYASAEMLEGEVPDPRDDLYALACVAYELLTGRHPFNKTPANEARDKNLVPPPVKGLTRRQLKGLHRGLEFAREDRSQSVEQFLEELAGHKTPIKNPLIAGPIALAIIALATIPPIVSFFREREIESKIEHVRSGVPDRIESILAELSDSDYNPTDRDRILVASRTQIIGYFQKQLDAQVDLGSGAYNFDGANDIIERVAAIEIFKDSANVQQWRERIDTAESVLLNKQIVLFNESIAANRLLPLADKEDIYDALEIIKTISPDTHNALIARLPGTYSAAIDRAIVNEEFDIAKKLSAAGLDTIPNDKNLENLVAKIEGSQERTERTKEISIVAAKIRDPSQDVERISALRDIQLDIKNLARLEPNHEILNDLKVRVSALAENEFTALANERNWAASDLATGDYDMLLRSLGLRAAAKLATTWRREFDADMSKRIAGVSAVVAAGQLAAPAKPSAGKLIANLRSIAEHHPYMEIAKSILARAYLKRVRGARAQQNFSYASTQLAFGQNLSENRNIRAAFEVERNIVTSDSVADEAHLEDRLATRQKEFDRVLPIARQELSSLGSDLAAVDRALTRYDALVSLSPSDSRLEDLRQILTQSLAAVSDQLSLAGKWDAALDVTVKALVQLPGSQSLAGNLILLQAKQTDALVATQQHNLRSEKRHAEALLNKPNTTREWFEKLRNKIADIELLIDDADSWLSDKKNAATTFYVDQAARARSEQRFSAGANLLEKATWFAPKHVALVAERHALFASSESFVRERLVRERAAGIEALKQDFATQARAQDVKNADKTLVLLRQRLGSNDPFVTNEAPPLLADAYYKLAVQKASTNDAATALELAKNGLRLHPQDEELRLAVKEYTVDGNRQELQNVFGRDEDFDLEEALNRISEIQTLDPRVYSASESAWSTAVASRLLAMQKSSGTASNPLLARAKELFAGNVVIAAIEPALAEGSTTPAIAAEIDAAIDATLLTKAKRLLAGVAIFDATHPAIVKLKTAHLAKVEQTTALYKKYESEFAQEDFPIALATIEKARSLWKDNELFRTKTNELESIVNGIPQSESPCVIDLAGLGKRRKGTCFDMISSSAPGPTMVVVPGGASFELPFAIGKYEVTVGDFNNYCGASGVCDVQIDRNNRLPVTSVTLTQALAYSRWLSKRTGKKYRLPTVEEWDYAANAQGQQPRKDYNCRVEQNGQILKGSSTMKINAGKANGWGLYNYVGNVQEWVSDNHAYVARGGSFLDPFIQCGISLEKPHTGVADESTGFRLVQELY